MPVGEVIRVALIGAGRITCFHVRNMLKQTDTTRIVALCDPVPAAYAMVAEEFRQAGHHAPPCVPNMEQLLSDYQGGLDAVLIATPHAYHYAQAKACLEAGLDVLVEKPMVVTAAEAESLVEVTRRTGRLLVVAFNGGLSPQIRKARAILASGELGEVLAINASIWEDWVEKYTGHWKQELAMSGGGFMFDTGAHMLNTVADLAGVDFESVAAWLDPRGRQVDIVGAVMARLSSGALVTMLSVGATIPSVASEIYVFGTQGIMRAEAWGRRLEVQWCGEKEFHPVEVPPSPGSWDNFVAIRSGRIPNPCPPEGGLRMARLWDAIKESAAQDGVPVHIHIDRTKE